VHPGDDNAGALGACPKNELWYILQAEPGACLYAGFAQPVTRETFARSIRDGTVEPLLRKLYVKPGDALYIPAGLCHAIGGGLVLAEIQQNSDSTFRVFDWNRANPDGSARELHIEQALAVTDFAAAGTLAESVMADEDGVTVRRFPPTAHFTAAECRGAGTQRTAGFHLLYAAEGELRAGGACYPAGTTVFVPADTGPYRAESAGYWLRFTE
jgi:mannose-6-phosphate isomerase